MDRGNTVCRELTTLIAVSNALIDGRLFLIPVLLRGWLNRQVRVSVDEGFEAGISLGVGDLPGKPPENHAQEDDGDTPNISLPRIIGLLAKDLWSEVGIATDDASRWCMRLARIVEDSGSAEIDELHDIVRCHDAVVEFKVTVGKTHFVQVLDTIAYLAEYAVNFRAAHLSRHDDTEQIERSVLHDLIIVAMVRNDINGLDDIGMFQGGSDAEFGGDLLLILALGFARTLWPELFNSENTSTILVAGLDEAYSSTSTASENTAPFAILFRKMGVSSVLERDDGMASWGGGTRAGRRFVALHAVSG